MHDNNGSLTITNLILLLMQVFEKLKRFKNLVFCLENNCTIFLSSKVCQIGTMSISQIRRHEDFCDSPGMNLVRCLEVRKGSGRIWKSMENAI